MWGSFYVHQRLPNFNGNVVLLIFPKKNTHTKDDLVPRAFLRQGRGAPWLRKALGTRLRQRMLAWYFFQPTNQDDHVHSLTITRNIITEQFPLNLKCSNFHKLQNKSLRNCPHNAMCSFLWEVHFGSSCQTELHPWCPHALREYSGRSAGRKSRTSCIQGTTACLHCRLGSRKSQSPAGPAPKTHQSCSSESGESILHLFWNRETMFGSREPYLVKKWHLRGHPTYTPWREPK